MQNGYLRKTESDLFTAIRDIRNLFPEFIQRLSHIMSLISGRNLDFNKLIVTISKNNFTHSHNYPPQINIYTQDSQGKFYTFPDGEQITESSYYDEIFKDFVIGQMTKAVSGFSIPVGTEMVHCETISYRMYLSFEMFCKFNKITSQIICPQHGILLTNQEQCEKILLLMCLYSKEETFLSLLPPELLFVIFSLDKDSLILPFSDVDKEISS